MKIIYVHHGNRKLGNPPTQEDDLTEIGYKDCELVAQLLNNKDAKANVKAIYTSQFFRCKKTAEIINKNLNVPIIEDKRLDEYGSIKDETWVDLQNRVTECIDQIQQTYNNDDIIICVTSGLNICAFINKAYNLPASNNTPFIFVPNCCPLIFNYENRKRK